MQYGCRRVRARAPLCISNSKLRCAEGFVLASDQSLDPLPTPEQVDLRMEESIEGTLRMLDGIALHGLFMVSAHVRHAVTNESMIYTLADPPKR